MKIQNFQQNPLIHPFKLRNTKCTRGCMITQSCKQKVIENYHIVNLNCWFPGKKIVALLQMNIYI